MWTLTNSGKLIDKIESKQDELTAWEWIEIKNWLDYSAMQWPCPDGFHIPTKTERNEVCKILTYTFWLTNNGDTIKTYLKMPFSGIRSENSSNVGSQGTIGRYWYCTPYSTSNAFYLLIDSTVLTIQGTRERAEWLTIRSFKDEIVIPDSSWTTLYNGSSVAAWAWVFHNATLWLISISWNGNTWYTMADKNVWATTVYNSWDTLSQANCGNYYQWGNNYWFPFTGSVTSSTTQVDASNYWPWNYYYSSTFIIRNSSPYDWSSVQNDDLRWWVTWIVTLNNAVTNTWVLSVNGQIGNVTIPAWSEIVYCTQAEYDALPSSKLTDGKSYVICE